jgi:hypothetical protein
MSSGLLSKNVRIEIHKIIILPVESYRCANLCHVLREEHRRRVFANRVLRRIFGPNKDEIIRGWIKLHNEELCNLYSSPSIIGMVKSGSNA